MKAVILAGGFGSRLAEETMHKPKPMVEIGGRPILWHIMNIFSATASPAWAARMNASWRSQALKFSMTDSGVRSRISLGIRPSPVSASQSRCGNRTTRATRLASHGSVERSAARACRLTAVNSASSPISSSPA